MGALRIYIDDDDDEMLEQLQFVLGGCVGEGTQDSDRIVAFN